MLGPMLPLLATRWHLSDFDAGYLFTAQFLASLITSAASGVLINRLGYRWALFCSLLLMAFGVAMLDQKSWQVGMTAVCIYGAGFGLSSPTGNLWIAEMNPERPAVALNLVNFSWGAGAVGAPLAIAALERSGQVIWTTYATSAAAVALCIWLASARFAAVPAPVKTQRLPHAATEPERMRVLRGQFYSALVLCVLFFTYVGTETSIGGWVAVHARRLSVGGGTLWATVPAIFWGALLLGRAAAPILLRIVRQNSLAVCGLIVALAGMACILAAHSPRLVAAGAGLAGFGLASVYPINLALLSEWFGSKAPKAGSVIFPASGLGGAVLPWLVGLTSTYFAGGLRLGLFVPLFGIILMLVFYLTYVRSMTANAA
jgi:FHS family glucose/mannose:H+ symporter-like MFS transporter